MRRSVTVALREDYDARVSRRPSCGSASYSCGNGKTTRLGPLIFRRIEHLAAREKWIKNGITLKKVENRSPRARTTALLEQKMGPTVKVASRIHSNPYALSTGVSLLYRRPSDRVRSRFTTIRYFSGFLVNKLISIFTRTLLGTSLLTSRNLVVFRRLLFVKRTRYCYYNNGYTFS